jgi:hypothetical protein
MRAVHVDVLLVPQALNITVVHAYLQLLRLVPGSRLLGPQLSY